KDHTVLCNAPCSTDFSRPGYCRRDPRGKATGRPHRQQADGRYAPAPRLAGSACRAGVRVSPIVHPLRFHTWLVHLWLGSLVLLALRCIGLRAHACSARTPDCSSAEWPTSLGDARTERWLRRTVQSETPVPPKVGFET